MMIHSRMWCARSFFGFTLAALVALGALPLAAQEPSGGKPADAPTTPALKKVVDPSRRVPPLFGQVGLTPEQKEEIYKIRAKHQAQIESLQKQIAQTQAELLTECEAVLSDSQKQLLALRREAAARSRASKRAATVTPVSSKTEAKSGS